MKWTTKKGKVLDISYSTKIQKRLLLIMTLLLIAVVILILIIIAGGVYSYLLVERIDALDPLARMVCQ